MQLWMTINRIIHFCSINNRKNMFTLINLLTKLVPKGYCTGPCMQYLNCMAFLSLYPHQLLFYGAQIKTGGIWRESSSVGRFCLFGLCSTTRDFYNLSRRNLHIDWSGCDEVDSTWENIAVTISRLSKQHNGFEETIVITIINQRNDLSLCALFNEAPCWNDYKTSMSRDFNRCLEEEIESG